MSFMAIFRRAKRLVILVSVAVALLAAGALIIKYVPPYVRRRHVAGLVEQFRAKPCQKTADPLIQLLIDHQVTHETGNEILGTLLFPNVTTKDSYAIGEAVQIHVDPMFPVKVEGMFGGYENVLRVEGMTGPDGDKESQSLIVAEDLSHRFIMGNRLSVVSPPLQIDQPGTYQGYVKLEYWLDEGIVSRLFSKFKQPSIVEKALTRLGLRKPEPAEWKLFHCWHRVPIKIRVVDPASLPVSRPHRPQ